MAQVFGQGDGVGQGVAFLVSAALTYDVISATNSSPQTTEINVGTRGATLFKWVHLGLAQALLFIFAAAYFDRRHARPILMGGLTAAAIMELSYLHARSSGLRKGGPGTESIG